MTFEERIEAAKAIIPLAYHDVLIRGIGAFLAGDTVYVIEPHSGNGLRPPYFVAVGANVEDGELGELVPLQPKEVPAQFGAMGQDWSQQANLKETLQPRGYTAAIDRCEHDIRCTECGYEVPLQPKGDI